MTAKSDTHFEIDWMRYMWVFLIASVLVVGASVALVLIRGLNFGVDFAGGYEIQLKFPNTVSESKIREALDPLGIDFGVQQYGAPADNTELILVRKQGTISLEERLAIEEDFRTLAHGPDKITAWSMAESGENIQVGFASPTSEAEVRSVLDKYNLQVKTLTPGEREDQPLYSIQLVSLADKIERTLRKAFQIKEDWPFVARVDFVGPQVGEQLRNQGFMAILYSFVFILLYIAVRFDLFFAPGAIIALIHDVAVVLGVMAITQLEFNLTVVAGVLTIVGYSNNDTVVVYDRVRENLVRLRGRDLRSLVNTSMNETFSRTILTHVTTQLVVVAVFIFGGEVLKPFSVAMMAGIFIGTYSSIYIATPVYIVLKEYFQKKSPTTVAPA